MSEFKRQVEFSSRHPARSAINLLARLPFALLVMILLGALAGALIGTFVLSYKFFLSLL